MSTTATRLLSPVAALALALTPVTVSGQTRAVPGEVVWHWFGECASSDSLVLEVSLDGKSLYSSAFPICQARRRDIRPEPQQRILEFRFDAVAHRFKRQYRATGAQPIEGNVWEAGRERNAILLGVQFVTEDQVLLNMHHVARADAASRSERIRGLVITTRPARRGERSPPGTRLKLPGTGK
ncbi:MAG: hypothetical protein AUG80_03285 [Candidatus Rokubacteria bacterium 13_1_20CM_4_68_9]|nr:MAG: hypothetical protein AUG80_03285 [Candidatus Rokubacteria bacterium 13_1_20CM_4_68_9]